MFQKAHLKPLHPIQLLIPEKRILFPWIPIQTLQELNQELQEQIMNQLLGQTRKNQDVMVAAVVFFYLSYL